jgi:hypothetical protein
LPFTMTFPLEKLLTLLPLPDDVTIVLDQAIPEIKMQNTATTLLFLISFLPNLPPKLFPHEIP